PRRWGQRTAAVARWPPGSICLRDMETTQTYDEIGRRYSRHRRPDPRIAAQIERALGDARRVVDVGSGTGSYECAERDVVAVEPSAVMVAQRPAGAAPVVRADAGELPFPDH